MSTHNFDSSLKEIPFLLTSNDVVTEMGHKFTELTGYIIDDILHKPISEVLIKHLMATCYSTSPALYYDQNESFIFTKDYEVREVSISKYKTQNSGEIIYTFIEKSNSRLDGNRFPVIEAMYLNNVEGVAIFCVKPDIILLKANQTYLDFFNKPFNCKENSVGRRIHDFVAGWFGSTSHQIWNNILSTGKPFYSDEYEYIGLN